MNRKKNDIKLFIFGLLAMVLVNVLATYFFARIDLTSDKRYTINETTKKTLSALKETVYIKVYLHGNFPAGFKRLEQAANETLEEFKAYGGSNIQFRFIDPMEESDIKKRKKTLTDLVNRGLQPTNVYATEDGKQTEKLVFPGAIVSYLDKEVAVSFLKGNQLSKAQDQLNQSIEGLEYELASAIKKVTQSKRKKIAFIDGHNELSDAELNDLMITLADYYEVGRMNLSANPTLEGIDAVVIAQPKAEFTDLDKYKLDQYIMKGGKALFFIDAMEARTDSNGMQALPFKLNISDLLFRYGVRVNENLVQDLQAAPVPIKAGSDYRLLPWSFFPLLNVFGDHAMVKNMGALYSRNISTIDTIKTPGIKKTPLIFTSKYTRVKGYPVIFSAEELRINLDKRAYTRANLPVSFLLEGSFTSLFKGRPVPVGAASGQTVTETTNNKMIVCSDGDLLASEIDFKSGRPFPLGYDKFTRQTFSNKDFVKNAIDYLLDEEGIINLRTKEVTLRPLDTFKIKEEKTYWQIVNLVVPVLAVLFFGIVRWVIRKRRFSRF